MNLKHRCMGLRCGCNADGLVCSRCVDNVDERCVCLRLLSPTWVTEGYAMCCHCPEHADWALL
jgi:hypothetical protein